MNAVTVEPQHDKNNKIPCAPSEDSRSAWASTDWVVALAGLNLCWAHRSFCLFCHAEVHLLVLTCFFTSSNAPLCLSMSSNNFTAESATDCRSGLGGLKVKFRKSNESSFDYFLVGTSVGQAILTNFK